MLVNYSESSDSGNDDDDNNTKNNQNDPQNNKKTEINETKEEKEGTRTTIFAEQTPKPIEKVIRSSFIPIGADPSKANPTTNTTSLLNKRPPFHSFAYPSAPVKNPEKPQQESTLEASRQGTARIVGKGMVPSQVKLKRPNRPIEL